MTATNPRYWPAKLAHDRALAAALQRELASATPRDDASNDSTELLDTIARWLDAVCADAHHDGLATLERLARSAHDIISDATAQTGTRNESALTSVAAALAKIEAALISPMTTRPGQMDTAQCSSSPDPIADHAPCAADAAASVDAPSNSPIDTPNETPAEAIATPTNGTLPEPHVEASIAPESTSPTPTHVDSLTAASTDSPDALAERVGAPPDTSGVDSSADTRRFGESLTLPPDLDERLAHPTPRPTSEATAEATSEATSEVTSDAPLRTAASDVLVSPANDDPASIDIAALVIESEALVEPELAPIIPSEPPQATIDAFTDDSAIPPGPAAGPSSLDRLVDDLRRLADQFRTPLAPECPTDSTATASGDATTAAEPATTPIERTPTEPASPTEATAAVLPLEADAPPAPFPPTDPLSPVDPTATASPVAPTDPLALIDPLAPNNPLAPSAPDGLIDPAFPSAPELGATGELTTEQVAALSAAPSDDFAQSEWGSIPIQLPTDKLEVLQFLVADTKGSLDQFDQAVAMLSQFGTRDEGAGSLRDLVASLSKLSEFFDFRSVKELCALLNRTADAITTVPEALMPELLIRVRASHTLLAQHVRALEVGMEMRWPLGTLCERVDILLSGRRLHRDIVAWHNNDPDRLLELDAVCESIESPPHPATSADPDQTAQTTNPATNSASNASTGSPGSAAPGAKVDAGAATVRIPASVLDQLMSMVSQLVLAKNRITAGVHNLTHASGQDQVRAAAADLTQLCSSMQATVMTARMQPIGRLFERYPRVVSDIANLAEKRVELTMSGESTLIDKKVLDSLAEPLSQLLRMIVANAVELPAARATARKPETATIRLRAENHSNHVVLDVWHDGLEPDRELIAKRAVESGAFTPERLDALDDHELLALMFHDCFNDPQTANIARTVADLKGRLSVSIVDAGTLLQLAIPLSVAIIPAMTVGVGNETYALPLQCIQEIVNVKDCALHSIRGRRVIRHAGSVIPLIDVAALTGRADPDPAHDHVAIIVRVGRTEAALAVRRIVSSQEIVVSPLDARYSQGDLFVGATILDDGLVSLIFEPASLLRQAETAFADQIADNGAAETLKGPEPDAELRPQLLASAVHT